MSKANGYGAWYRPMFGELRTRGGRVVNRRHDMLIALPREGSGDYRHPCPTTGNVERRTAHVSAEFHNPVTVAVQAPYRAPWLPEEFIRLENGQGEFVPYRWRQPGWQERLARFGLLDLVED